MKPCTRRYRVRGRAGKHCGASTSQPSIAALRPGNTIVSCLGPAITNPSCNQPAYALCFQRKQHTETTDRCRLKKKLHPIGANRCKTRHKRSPARQNTKQKQNTHRQQPVRVSGANCERSKKLRGSHYKTTKNKPYQHEQQQPKGRPSRAGISSPASTKFNPPLKSHAQFRGQRTWIQCGLLFCFPRIKWFVFQFRVRSMGGVETGRTPPDGGYTAESPISTSAFEVKTRHGFTPADDFQRIETSYPRFFITVFIMNSCNSTISRMFHPTPPPPLFFFTSPQSLPLPTPCFRSSPALRRSSCRE